MIRMKTFLILKHWSDEEDCHPDVQQAVIYSCHVDEMSIYARTIFVVELQYEYLCV